MDQSFVDFLLGVGIGLLLAAVAGLSYRAYQYAQALDLDCNNLGEPFSHNDLFAAISDRAIITLLDSQAGELCEEYGNALEQVETLDQHLDEALTRNTQLHKEICQMARIINDLQDKVGRGLIEIDHCHASCDELRAKLDAKAGA
jgi:hypothetical protein